MKCACCGKTKRFYESYAPLDANMNVCIKCDTILCRIKDAFKDNQIEQFNENVNIIKSKIKNEEFAKWFENYLKDLDKATHNSDAG